MGETFIFAHVSFAREENLTALAPGGAFKDKKVVIQGSEAATLLGDKYLLCSELINNNAISLLLPEFDLNGQRCRTISYTYHPHVLKILLQSLFDNFYFKNFFQKVIIQFKKKKKN